MEVQEKNEEEQSVESKQVSDLVLKDISNKKPERKAVKMVCVRRYVERKDGWIQTRAHVPYKANKVRKRDDPVSQAASVKVVHSDSYKQSVKHLYHKEKRYPCPDCTAWYSGDERKLQLSCRHKQRYETEEELKWWDIGFSSDSD